MNVVTGSPFRRRSSVRDYSRLEPLAAVMKTRWVYVLGIVIAVLVLAAVVVHVAGGGLHGHALP